MIMVHSISKSFARQALSLLNHEALKIFWKPAKLSEAKYPGFSFYFFLTQFNLSLLLFVCLGLVHTDCNKKPSGTGSNPPPPPVTTVNDVNFWLTKGDQSALLQKQTVVLSFGTLSNSNSFIDVDSTIVYQTVDGFGYTLTGGSAYVINQMSAGNKSSLLQELFA